ncbi:MAG: hypothetical protein VX046_04645, partial [Bacteroidota bacterium]|nr:hypothetical protein [Bacteroidota bacterium]
EHKRGPVGRKRRLILKIDNSNIQAVADGSDITTVVAYLVDAGGAVKRLSDEFVRFSVEGEGELVGDDKAYIQTQKLLWGEAVALVRSSTKAGEIRVHAKLLEDGINIPEFAEIKFNTTTAKQELYFSELPTKVQIESRREPTDESEVLRKLRIELKKTKKKLQQYELNKVGKQQEQFIE